MNSEYQQKISKEEINALPPACFDKEIFVINNQADFQKAVKYLNNQTEIGFDTETKPAFKKGIKNKVALIQLSSLNKAFLFRTMLNIDFSELFKILSNKSIIKIGADINQDLKSLQNIQKFKPQAFIDIQKYTEEYGIADNGLRKLVAIVLKIKISKSQQLTNWEADELTINQQIYAATDAWACLKIYKTLNKSINVKQ